MLTTTSGWHGKRTRAFDANVEARRRRMAAERAAREDSAGGRNKKLEPVQNVSQPEPFSEARYGSVMAMRGSERWYAALCRRLAILEDVRVDALAEDPARVRALATKYRDCFQPGIVEAVDRYHELRAPARASSGVAPTT
mgnify:FL=1|jgi:hypothetical protein